MPPGPRRRSHVAGKARVYELAKELGVESKAVLAKLKEIGEFVKSASSTIEAPVVRKLRESLPRDGSSPQPHPPAAAGQEGRARPSTRRQARVPRRLLLRRGCPVAPRRARTPVAEPG